MKIIVGLGNPGKEYEKTRHNVGKFFLDKLQSKIKLKDKNFIFPDQFMNNSGPALRKALGKFKTKPRSKDILVIHDDLDIELGRVKLTFAKSSAGHKGVGSIIKSLKTDKFWRLRVGIGPKRSANWRRDHKKMKDFLLRRLTPAEEKLINKNTKKIKEGVEVWLKKPEQAMAVINKK